MEFLRLLASSRHPYREVWIADIDDDEKTAIPLESEYVGRRRSFSVSWGTFVVSHVLLLIIYLGSSSILWRQLQSSRSHGPQLLSYSPAQHMLDWEERRFVLGDRIQEDSTYTGRPSAELDKAWHDLLNIEYIRVPSQIIDDLGRETEAVRVPGEDEYIGTLNVYHEIHCLKRLHQNLYPDTYWPNMTDEMIEHNRLHNEHCIDYLLQSVMCHGDVGVITYYWSPDSRFPIANETTHQCIKWDSFEQWMQANTVDLLQPGWLVHPTLGLVYPDGKGSATGVAG